MSAAVKTGAGVGAPPAKSEMSKNKLTLPEPIPSLELRAASVFKQHAEEAKAMADAATLEADRQRIKDNEDGAKDARDRAAIHRLLAKGFEAAAEFVTKK